MTLGTPAGATIQLSVSDGHAGREWYERLFGRGPDFRPFDDDTFCEWQFQPGFWELHVVKQEPAGSQRGRLRFGVSDIARRREAFLAVGVDISDVEEFRGVVSWRNFDDPWGNRLGVYQDLSRWP